MLSSGCFHRCHQIRRQSHRSHTLPGYLFRRKLHRTTTIELAVSSLFGFSGIALRERREKSFSCLRDVCRKLLHHRKTLVEENRLSDNKPAQQPKRQAPVPPTSGSPTASQQKSPRQQQHPSSKQLLKRGSHPTLAVSITRAPVLLKRDIIWFKATLCVSARNFNFRQ